MTQCSLSAIFFYGFQVWNLCTAKILCQWHEPSSLLTSHNALCCILWMHVVRLYNCQRWRHVMTHNCLQTQLTARHQLNYSAVKEWTAAEDEGDIIPPTNMHIDTYTRFIRHELMQSNTVLQLLLLDFMNWTHIKQAIGSAASPRRMWPTIIPLRIARREKSSPQTNFCSL